MPALFDILKDSAIALLSGSGGVGAAVWKLSGYIHQNNARLQIIEEKLKSLATFFDEYQKEQHKRWEEMEAGCAKCRGDISNRFDTNRGEHGRFVSVAAFNSFVKEQGELWQEMNRTLGRIEGEITARRSSWTTET